MEWSNEKIKQLIEERNKKISYYNNEIQKEIQKEKAKYKFSWTRFILVIGISCLPYLIYNLYNINAKIFPADSIWSWQYWIHLINK